MSTILDVTIEPSTSSAGPIGSLVVINPWPTVQEAEEDVMRRADHNSDVSAPYHQIARPRKRDSLKPFYSYVEIRGTRVVVGKPGLFVNGVNQMRTVMLGIPPFGI